MSQVWGMWEIVDAAMAALKAEDVAFQRELKKNPAGRKLYGGILRIMNERYYQFVIARYFAARLPFIVRVEDHYRDLTLSEPEAPENTTSRHAIVEMKRWFSSTGNSELAGIRADLFDNLQQDCRGCGPAGLTARHCIMMIFSANPPGLMDDNIRYLADKLGTPRSAWHAACFMTKDARAMKREFWVAGCDARAVVAESASALS